MFRRIAIVNRGEPARRLIHAVRELSAERPEPVRAIALHTDAERRATFVREADEAVLIGSEGGGNPYLDHPELERALIACGADAAWVGWGFVAEDPAFAELCARIGVAFIGPPAEVMRRLGDKVAAKLLAESVGVPVAPWSGGAVASVEEALEHAGAIGYPLMIKAAAGGGGRGIRLVASEAELASALERAREEARRSFGDPSLLMERLVAGARHVEVQVIADHHGGAWAVGVRDCSVQRRSQKLIEESASPVLDADQAAELRAAALSLVQAAGYRNAGTVEFLYQPEERLLAFLEVNTRLQVEHPVTEAVTGLDLVKLQIHVAEGGRLEGEPPSERGHAIEARLNAEDAERGFAPAPGTVELLALPTGPGIRVDTGISEGEAIAPEYDSMIAKIIAWGADRAEARSRLRRALAEMAVVVRGGATNRAFLLDLLDRPEVIAGTADTRWLDRLAEDGGLVPERNADVALLAAAVEAYDAGEALEREAFYASARRGRPSADGGVGRMVELRHRGESYRAAVARTGPRDYRVRVDGVARDVSVERLGRFESRLSLEGRIHRVVSVFHPPDHLVEVDGVAHRVSRDEGGLVRAPAPALVVAVTVAAGDRVEAGDPVAVLESMKMETTVSAPFDANVAEVLVAGNVQVGAGAPLVRLEPLADEAAASDAPRVRFDAPAEGPPPAPRARAERVLEAMRGMILGFDVPEEVTRSLPAELERARAELAPDDPELLRAELGVLGLFADLAALSRDRPPVGEGEEDGELVHSPREHFHQYLRSLDAEREGVPEPLVRSIARALAHYGVQEGSPRGELAEAAYRIFLAQQRASAHLPAVAALLEGRLRAAGALPEPLGDELRETLDRLVTATQLRAPAIGELARSVRYARFDRPLLEVARERAYAGVRDRLAMAAAADPDDPGRAEHLDAVVASPQPLLPLLGERMSAGVDAHEPMLEVLTRRYYKIRALRDVSRRERDGRSLIASTYERNGRRVGLVTTLAEASELVEAARAVAAEVAEGTEPGGVVADIYVVWADPPDPDAMAERIGAALAEADLPERLRRMAVAVAVPGTAATHHFTFRPGAGGLEEERVVRDLHPMIARRLQIGRLDNFTLARLPSVDDTHLFHCVAREGEGDERFVALAEVRDISSLRDAEGRLTVPEVEHVLAGCLEGIRGARAARPDGGRLQSNHVFLYVWPPVRLPQRELALIARRLAPMTAGLGLEEVLVQLTLVEEETGTPREMALRFSWQPGAGAGVGLAEAPDEPLAPLDGYAQKVLSSRRRGTVYPYEVTSLLAGAGGTFTEHDLDESGRLAPVERPPGGNTAGIVVGVVTTPTDEHPEGMTRVALLGDPTKALGSLAEPECARVEAAIDLAEAMGVPVEWFALSAGAKIARDSGTENMDWVARVLRRIILFTQAGGEINVVVAGINVGAQPYWNAEATMLMHTRGILVMTPDSAMVLTGKQALDYSGGVSAEDNLGIGGYDRIMGPNGQAQYWAPHLVGACETLLAYYARSYVAPGERFPRRAASIDPVDRDVRPFPHAGPGSDFRTVGDIFAAETNPERKKAFDVRTLMRAVLDQDREPLERWAGMADADTAVVLDAHLGGWPVSMLGIESRAIARRRFLPADGPDQWTAGTLFPLSSKKVARAINAASGGRPLVVLANLSGFDGSPESLRKWQLEYGAEIGRAVVNFDGPIVFCVVSRFHGGAFVVFSVALNEDMQVLAVEGSRASVIGGAPAAAVVFAGDVNKRTAADPRVADLEARAGEAEGEERARLRAELADVRAAVRSEKLGEVAMEFDRIHSVERAREVGSVHEIIPAAGLRPRLIEALERGMARFGASRG